MYFAVTIDTEEDNWGEYDRSSFSVENLRRIPRLQRMFDERGVRPTYLISYPVASSDLGVQTLRPIMDDGRCEVGTHPHPWNTPPLEEPRTAHNSFISNLHPDLQFRKIKTLHDTITGNFGTVPRSYRSGRWGFSDAVARNLIRLGYCVDTSIAPLTDWSDGGGPDYSGRWSEPFVYASGDAVAGGGTLLEVPATIDFLQHQRHVAVAAQRLVKRIMPMADKMLAGLARLNVLNYVWLSPETHTASQMNRLIAASAERGCQVVNMFFHSPSLLEGCSPFVRTAGQLDDFLTRIDAVLQFGESIGLQPITLSELPGVLRGLSEHHLQPITSDRPMSLRRREN